VSVSVSVSDHWWKDVRIRNKYTIRVKSTQLFCALNAGNGRVMICNKYQIHVKSTQSTHVTNSPLSPIGPEL